MPGLRIPFLCADMLEAEGNDNFVELLTVIPDDEDDEVDMNARNKALATFIGECLVPVYGTHKIKKWCSKNKGKRFLDMLEMSCLSYAITLLMDKHIYWRELVKLEDGLGEIEERKLYKKFKRCNKGMSQETHVRFKVAAKPKFTVKKNRVLAMETTVSAMRESSTSRK